MDVLHPRCCGRRCLHHRREVRAMVGVGSLLRAGPGQPFRGAVQWGVILSECTMDDGLLPVRGSGQITILITIQTTTKKERPIETSASS
jgi:hypothetical protein